MFKALFSAATGALGGIQTYLIVGAVALVAGSAAGAYAGYRWEHGEVLKLQLADAKFAATAVKAAQLVDGLQYRVDLKAATTEAYAQGALQARTVTLTKEIVRYVTPKQDASVCGLTVGLARVLRAAAAGADPATLALAPGQSDDDCSDVTPSQVAGWFTAYAGIAQQNAEQLTALQVWIAENHAAQVTP